MERTRLVLGAMTGTSIDGIDLALAEIRGTGLSMSARLAAFRSAPLGTLAMRLRAAADQQPITAGELAELSRELGELHAREASELLREAAVPRIDLAAIHGQTVFHRPPTSLQLLNAHPIAAALGCDVVFDLRGQDLALGGQGAPLTPLSDWVLYRAPHARAVVNLGGFANATILAADQGAPPARQVAAIHGADLCACNQLLDRAARAAIGRDFDADGAVAASGQRHERAFAELSALLAPQPGARSLGTGDEAFAWIDRHLGALAPADLLATAADAIGSAIGRALAARGVSDAVLAGGGARHARLARAIAHAAGVAVQPSDRLGIPVAAREALGWAVLGALAQDGTDVSLPQVTHRPAMTPDSALPRPIPGTWLRIRTADECGLNRY
jgi:1,6-anhydro-N-acetylmuramate kinase